MSAPDNNEMGLDKDKLLNPWKKLKYEWQQQGIEK